MGKKANELIREISSKRSEINKLQEYIEEKRNDFEMSLAPDLEKLGLLAKDIKNLNNTTIPVQYGKLIDNIKNLHANRGESVIITTSCNFTTDVHTSFETTLKEYSNSAPELFTNIQVYGKNNKYRYFISGNLPTDIEEVQADGKTFREHMHFIKEGITPDVPNRQRLTLSDYNNIIANYTTHPFISDSHISQSEAEELIANSEFDELIKE